MTSIQNYNASYPLSYYTVGTVYTFYGTSQTSNTTPASSVHINKYSSKLLALEQEKSAKAIKPVTGAADARIRTGGLSRYYAVVVEKTSSQKSPCITVMFLNRYNGHTEYLLKKYAVSHPVYSDGKDLMPLSTSTNLKGENADSKIGRLTQAKKAQDNVGRLTLSRDKQPPSDSIGKLTHTNNSAQPKVGGLTWVKR